MGWTKLEGTPLWAAAESAYSMNGGIYHGFDHPKDMYRYASDLKLPYCRSLDRAILAHDVIIDLGHGASECASAEWLEAMLGECDAVACELIMTTAEHSPKHQDSRLALLDLYSLSDPVIADRNSLLLLEEAKMKAAREGRVFDLDTWVKGTCAYLEMTASNIRGDLIGYEGKDRQIWAEIARGASQSACGLEALILSTEGPAP